MTELTVYQIDAFANAVFKGNPAAVVPLQDWLPDDVLLNMAKEHNQSETAYFVPLPEEKYDYELRWFTTQEEVELCGHATLASSYVIFNELGHAGDTIRFKTRFAGDLAVTRNADLLILDFPAREPETASESAHLASALNIAQKPLAVLRDVSKIYFVYDDAQTILSADPDFKALGSNWVCITAPGTDTDFVSRFFTPGDGHEEDPVTGSTHCTLTPYWAKRLGKTAMTARQLSERGGFLKVELVNDRVKIAGHAVLYSKGRINL